MLSNIAQTSENKYIGLFKDYHGWYILYGVIEQPIGIGYLNILSITELQE